MDHISASFALAVVAVVCYGLAAFSVKTGRFQGVPAGHALVVLAFLAS